MSIINPAVDFVDYYKVLEIGENATEDQVKKSYRKLARKFHPDLNPSDKGAVKRFQQINEANQVLSDPEKRNKYDAYIKDWNQGHRYQQSDRSRSQGDRGGAPFTEDRDGDFSSFFESVFGGSGRGRETKFKGQDYQADMTLNLADTLKVNQQMLNVNGKSIRVKIPAGVESGQVIRLKGCGAPGVNGGPAGDLYITVAINIHPHFKRLENDLYTTATISLYTAMLGGETIVETLDGQVKLKVIPETQPGTKIRLKNKGIPRYKKDGEQGDLYVTYEVKLPTQLTEKQKALFTELSETK